MSIKQPKLLRDYVNTVGRTKEGKETLERIMRNYRIRMETDPMSLLRYLLLLKLLRNDSEMILTALQQTRPEFVDVILRNYNPNSGIAISIGEEEYLVGYNEIQQELEIFLVYLKKYNKGRLPEKLNLSNYSSYVHELNRRGELDSYKKFLTKAVRDTIQMEKFIGKCKERAGDCQQQCYPGWQMPNSCPMPVNPNIPVYHQQMATQHFQPEKFPTQMQMGPAPMKIITNLKMEEESEDADMSVPEQQPEPEPDLEPVAATKPVPDMQERPPHVYEEKPVVRERPIEEESPWGSNAQQRAGNPFGVQPRAQPAPAFVPFTNPNYKNLSEEDLLYQRWAISDEDVNKELTDKFLKRLNDSLTKFYAKENDKEKGLSKGFIYIRDKQMGEYDFDIIIILFIRFMPDLPVANNNMIKRLNELATLYKKEFEKLMAEWKELPEDQKAAAYANKDNLPEFLRQVIILSGYKPKNGN